MRRTVPSALARLCSIAFALALVSTAAAAPAFAAPSRPSIAPSAAPAVDAPADSTLARTDRPDPDNDTIGWENGYWHNESIAVDQTDGDALNDTELEAYVARSMARVEYLREAEFESTVPVSVISREEYRNLSAGGGGDDPNRTEFNRWNDQVWEGLFVIGESSGSGETIGQTTGSSVLGFYSPTRDEITIVTGTPDAPTISNATLIHELVHALQDQRYDLTNATYRGATQDGDLAIDGVVEGEANYIEDRYIQRCGAEWDCVETPQAGGGGGGGGGSPPNLGVLITLLNPYSDGPLYVAEIVEEGGWDAFEERFVDPPVSTEQVIHRTDEVPTPIAFVDESTGDWDTFPTDNPQLGQNGSDTVGEASIYAMFWYQARTYGADTIDPNGLFDDEGEYDTYNYDAEPSAGWANDRLFPYRTGDGDDAAYGYVWVTEWDTERDAREFHDTYLRMLDAHDVRETDAGYHVVPSGPFADAFYVDLDGTRVTVVNGPTVDDVRDIRPSVAPDPDATPTPAPTADDVATTVATDTGGAGDDSGVDAGAGGDTSGTTETSGAGFGVVVAAAAVAVAGLLARRRD
ncbi:Hvo_1808 family surface protein [Halobaculum lipolyticum]|uniref:Hvo_1808 family surface protein n=1 Tax=Halobaculum lipolyticum TaxID=3032001 RepID=A0ABD5WIP7_9EURY|nr:Hvo_1808 family surface protein [Halobaculum sp. DT31]